MTDGADDRPGVSAPSGAGGYRPCLSKSHAVQRFWDDRRRRREALIHQENRARIQRERDAMARRWAVTDCPRPLGAVVDPEAALAAALLVEGHGYSGGRRS